MARILIVEDETQVLLLAESVLNSASAMFEVPFYGHYFPWVRITTFGIYSEPSPAAPVQEGWAGFISGVFLIPIFATALIVVAFHLHGRKQRLLSGLLVAMLGEGGLTLRQFHRTVPGWLGALRILGLIFFFAVLWLG